MVLRKAGKPPPDKDAPKIEVRTPNKSGYVGRVDKARYDAMRTLLLKILPKKEPGLTQGEMFAAAEAARPAFPGPVAWWVKCVQLDLEVQGVLLRDGGKPLRWRRA